MKTKEFISDGYVSIIVNKWLEENPAIKVIDIKYALGASSDGSWSGALILYED